MYTKQEISKQRQAFWTSFGRYMKPILSSDGEEVSWLNFKTRNKYVNFKMDADGRRAVISIVIDHTDAGRRQWYFDRLVETRGLFYEMLEEKDWTWEPETTDEQGRAMSIIYKELIGVNIFRQEDWPAIISFLKPRIIALDAFWSMVRYQLANPE